MGAHVLSPSLLVYSQTAPCSSPLGVTARYGHTEIVKKLVNGGANINYQNKVKNTYCTTEQ